MDERLPEGWVLTTLENVVIPERILEHPRENPLLKYVGLEHVEAETMRLIGTTPAQELKSAALHFWPEDVLYGRLRPYLNKVLQPDFEGLCSAEFLVFRKSVNLSPSYLQYFLNSWDFKEFASHQITGDRPRADWDLLKVFNFPLSPLSEQHRIVAAIEQQFTRLDNAVASLQSAKARAKQYRASLLKAAVEGELAKEWRAEHAVEETGAQLLERILDERRARWEEEQLAKMRERGVMPKDDKWKQGHKEPMEPNVEQLPALPEGWCWATVEQLADVGTGATPLRNRREYYDAGTISWITSSAVNADFIDAAEEFITEKALAETNTKVFPIGTLVLAMYGEGKTRGKVSELRIEAATNQACAGIVFRPFSYLCQPYVKYFLQSNYLQIRSLAAGGAQPNINLTIVKNTVVPIPPLAQQVQIVAEVEARLSNIAQMEETIEASLKRAEHERQSILREAFAGRLVPQNPEDESASMLLERIREERKKREEAEKIARVNRKGIQMEIAKRRRTGRASLYTTLVDAARPLPPDDLFKWAGLKADEQPESVEVFYEELHADVEHALVAETRPDYEHVLLEALEPSAEMLARMAEAEAARQARDTEQGEKTADTPTLWVI